MPVCLLLLLWSGCGRATPAGRRADVARYLNALGGWAAVELETGHAIERILATHFVDEAEVLRQIEESRPRLEQHLVGLGAYRATTTDVQNVHRVYLATWQGLLGAYDDIAAGLEDPDQQRLARGRQGLFEWRRGLRAVATDVADLAAAVGIEPKRERPE